MPLLYQLANQMTAVVIKKFLQRNPGDKIEQCQPANLVVILPIILQGGNVILLRLLLPVQRKRQAAYVCFADNEPFSCLVISHDVGLSERVIAKGATALDDRGNIYTAANIRERVSERDYMKAFREMGLNDLKQKSLCEKDYQRFSNSFDSLIAKLS